MKRGTLFILLLTFSFTSLLAQSNFSIENYKQFLSSHQNMDSPELLKMNDAGLFKKNLNLNADQALFFDSASIKYNLTEYEKSLIRQNGFVVSERLSRSSFGAAFLDIYHKDLPVYISTDAILHAFHMSYDRILKNIEGGVLIDDVTELLSRMHSKIPELASKYSAHPEMEQMLKDADVYISVAEKLLTDNTAPFYSSNLQKVNYLYDQAIKATGITTDTLFANACVVVDWSQFKPRGHYASPLEPDLQQYFRAMMWLGRIEIYLLPPVSEMPPCTKQDFNDAKRQVVLSYLLAELIQISDSKNIYDEIEEVLSYFVGEPDNVTLDNLLYLKDALSLQSPDELLDSLKLSVFQDSLRAQSFANQKILSQILFSNNINEPDSIVPPSSFLLFGQRFIIDSYVTASVVFDRIYYNNEKVCRLFPSTLDPIYVLGNNAAAQLLVPQLDQYHYSSNLAALRYLADSYDDEFWGATIYNSWLNMIRKLNPPDSRDNLPIFMQTAAYWQSKLNTQLASWAQLRHDNLLYAKQSYTGGTTCSYPCAYVEPFPEFYSAIKEFGESALVKFNSVSFTSEPIKLSIANYLNNLVSIMDTLLQISEKILRSEDLTSKEEYFLQTIIFQKIPIPCGEYPLDGWYTKLLYNDIYFEPPGVLDPNNIVADIHTIPTDCGGNVKGWVTHVGTGPVDIGIYVIETGDGQTITYAGPSLSYYEHTTDNFLRLTDQEWESEHLQSALRPEWVNSYLANTTGNSRPPGISLLTDVISDKEAQIPLDYLTAANYPNPFNPSTIISFTIPYDLSNSQVSLTIYNLQGEEITTLINETLSAGNYLARWNGTNSSGAAVTSGVYVYNLKAGSRQYSGKMTLVK